MACRTTPLIGDNMKVQLRHTLEDLGRAGESTWQPTNPANVHLTAVIDLAGQSFEPPQ